MASDIFIQVLQSVNYLHEKKPHLIHYNLKPSNVLFKIVSNNRHLIKIADFGLFAIRSKFNDTNKCLHNK
jgi:serine/threonine protein kinase